MTSMMSPKTSAAPMLDASRCQIMGVINVTPDSFSDGGKWFDHEAAIDHGRDLIAAGADMIDVGGESTRPGALRIDADEEMRRISAVIRELAGSGTPISVDTTRAVVARHALAAGASMLNDVSGGRADPQMFEVAAETGVPLVLMHWRGHSERMQDLTHYDDVVKDVIGELREQVRAAKAAGVDGRQIIIDPGLGFSKTGDHNWTVLHHITEFVELGFPVLLGASRKRFLGELLAHDGQLRPAQDRDAASAALTTVAAMAGVWGVRVHDVEQSADAARVVERMAREGR